MDQTIQWATKIGSPQ